MLSDGSVAAMRRQSEAAMREDCLIHRYQKLGDGMGGERRVPLPDIRTRCRFAPVSNIPSERALAGSRDRSGEGALYVPWNIDLDGAEEVTIQGRGRFRVVGIVEPPTFFVQQKVILSNG